MANQAIIAIVKGGLGNQLFIYAAARALALRTGRALYLDTKRGYTHDTFGRSYRLNWLPIIAKTMPEAWRVAPTLKHPRHKVIRALNKLLPRDRRNYVAERHHLDITQLTQLKPCRDHLTLLGYWQNEAYFANSAEMIRQELTPPEPTDSRNRELGRLFASGNTVSLHVRRIRYPYRLSAEYYQAAIHAARSVLKNPTFAIFGDDLDWASAMLDFGDSPVNLVAHNKDNEMADLWLMGRCRHAITANSSFSWWGAWLAGEPGPSRHVWAPAEMGVQLVPASGWHIIPGGMGDP